MNWIAEVHKKGRKEKIDFFSPKEAEILEGCLEELKKINKGILIKNEAGRGDKHYFLMEIPKKLYLKRGGEILKLTREIINDQELEVHISTKLGNLETLKSEKGANLRRFFRF